MHRLTCAFLAVLLAGCSLVDPFVTRTLEPRVEKAARPAAPAPAPGQALSLDEAFDYAARVKAAYRGAVRDQAQLQAWMALALIPLTAAAIGLGARGASPDAVLALGLAGSAGFGLGSWLYNKPRQLAWIAGLKAVTCAEDAMTPLNVAGLESELRNDITQLRAALDSLEMAAATLETEIDRSKAVRDGSDASKAEVARALRSLETLENASRAELQDTAAAVTTAADVLKSAAELQQVLKAAGRRLVVAVNKIADEVDALVVETQRDPQALANVIAGLGGTFGTLTSVPESVARSVAKDDASKKKSSVPQGGTPTDLLAAEAKASLAAELAKIKEQEGNLSAALNTVRWEAAATATARRVVSDKVNGVVKDAPLTKLKGCGVSAGDLITALAVDPAPPFTIIKPNSIVFTIKGGLPPYGALLAAGQSGLIVAAALPAVTVLATKDTADGDYAVVVSDSTGLRKTVPVTVRKGEAKDDDKPAPTPATLTQLAEKVSKDQPPVAAQGVTIKITGARIADDRLILSATVTRVAADSNTTDAAKALRAKFIEEQAKDLAAEKVGFDEATTNALLKSALDAKKSTPQGKRVGERVAPDAEFEKLSKADKEKLQKAVCLVGTGPNGVDGQWGSVTKGKVIDYQRRKRLPTTGVLTKDLVAELLALDDAQIRTGCGK